MCVRENFVKQCSLIPDRNSFRQECIPVGCVPPARYHTEVSMTETLQTETPPPHLDRDPSQSGRRPPGQRPPDRDPQTETPGQRTPEWESPRQRPLPIWTETPLDSDPSDRDPPGQRPLSLHSEPQAETPLGQKQLPWTEPPPPQTETTLDRDP